MALRTEKNIAVILTCGMSIKKERNSGRGAAENVCIVNYRSYTFFDI